MKQPHHLLDVNALIALIDDEHSHHSRVLKWFETQDHDWGVCAITEAGALRILSNPRVGRYSPAAVIAAVVALEQLPGYRYWPSICGWSEIPASLRVRVMGYHQISDAYLLGMAIRENGVLVTFDRAIRHLAGTEFRSHLLILE